MDMETRNGIAGATTGDLLENAVALSVELHSLGTRRKLPAGAVQTDADADMVHVSKDILESPRYEAIKALYGDIRGYVERRSVPAKALFRAGVVLVKTSKVPEIDAALELYAQQIAVLADEFVADYPAAIDRARARLGSLFDQEDYPAPAKVRAAFAMKTKYIEFGTPRGLSSISGEIYKREVAKAKADVERATEEVRQVLRAGLKDVTDHLLERLTPKADGSAKVFRNTLIGNVKEFLETFQARNIVNDRELEELVTRAGKILEGVNPDMLRDNDRVRLQVQSGFDQIKVQLDSMMVDAGRRFDFSE